MKEISVYSLLAPEEELGLGRLAQQGDQAAIQRLVEANLRFVIKIAKRYHDANLSLLDLIHEGNLGLIQAAKRFDPSRKLRFLTYAVWWIRQAILYAIANYGYPFRLPAKIRSHRHQINTVLRKRDESGVYPTIEEIGSECGLTTSEIAFVTQLKLETVSIDEPLYRDGEQSLQDVLPDMTQVSVEERLISKDLMRQLKNGVEHLTSREQDVLTLRFGLDGGDPKTLREIGSRIGLSRERIRQIQEHAIVKLRKNDDVRTLGSFL